MPSEHHVHQYNSVTLGLGSNLGDRLDNLFMALELLHQEQEITLKKISSVYQCPAEGFEGPDFLNLAAQFDTSLTPTDLLSACQKIERKIGKQVRKKRTKNYVSRLIDIDILIFGNIIYKNDTLSIPHPAISKRDFVKIPLQELGITVPFKHKNETETTDTKRGARSLRKENTLTEQLKTLLSLK